MCGVRGLTGKASDCESEVCGFKSRRTPFDELSYTCLVFLEEMTRNKEPWCGFGIATEVYDKIKEALERKHEWKVLNGR